MKKKINFYIAKASVLLTQDKPTTTLAEREHTKTSMQYFKKLNKTFYTGKPNFSSACHLTLGESTLANGWGCAFFGDLLKKK